MTNAKRRSRVASRTARWQRLASGRLGERARAIAASIGDELRDIDLDGERDVVPGLYLGHAGLALMFDQLCRTDRTGGWREPREHHLAKAIDQTLGQPAFSLQFGGLGVAWLLHRLDRDAGLPALDLTLRAFLRSSAAAATPYHLTFGLAGMAVYALERGFPNAYLAAIVDAFARSAERTRQGTTWKWQRPRAGHYNFSPLTGIPGVIAILAALGERLGWPPPAKALFASSLRWLLAQRTIGSTSLFPPRIPRPRRASTEPAYVYGEVGLAGIFEAVDHPLLSPLAFDLVELAAERCAEPGVPDDLTLCHGSAGVAHVFNRIAQRTGDPAHRELALRWLACTCDVIEDRRGKPRPWRTWCKRPGFVDGAAGVALVLAAATSTVEPTWDRLLLLSRPGET